MADIRWGILATGNIAEAFARDVARTPGAVVTAVGSRSPEAAQRFALEHDIPNVHGNWVGLATDSDVDVVYVATPHIAHHMATALCLQAGKAVLCEKPLTINASEARDLMAMADERDLFLMEAMWMQTNPAIREVLRLVSEGAIGSIVEVEADFGLGGPFPPAHRLRDPNLGGGALLDLGVYVVSLAHRLLGVPDSISSSATLTPEGVDAATSVQLGYGSGARAVLECGIESETAWVATITGTAGRIVLPRPFFVPDRYELNGSEVLVPHQGFVHEIEEVGRCLRAGLKESPMIPWRQTIEVMEILDAVRAQIGVRYPTE